MTIYTTDPNNWVTTDIPMDQAQGNISLKEKYEDIEGFFRSGWIPADQTWTFGADDDPTYTFTIAAFDATSRYSTGMRIKLTDSGTQFFIITKVVFDDPGSTITVYGGNQGDLSGGAITNPFFAIVKEPLDFSLNPDDWTEEVSDTTNRSQAAAVQDAWHNLGTISINIPIGIWNVEYLVCAFTRQAVLRQAGFKVTLSDANNTESDIDWTCHKEEENSFSIWENLYRRKIIELTTKDEFFLNTANTRPENAESIQNRNDDSKLFIRAICAYL